MRKAIVILPLITRVAIYGILLVLGQRTSVCVICAIERYLHGGLVW